MDTPEARLTRSVDASADTLSGTECTGGARWER
jgi:hypothetical protein